ncbi:MerR family transcriptional regulator [Metabacillus sp. GX 13764]|nr:MerR family transcriptional regulator [Metabacillus kandeliae]
MRYYEQIGLIHVPERSDGGTRLYTETDIERLKKVVLAKEILGFSLQELQQFLDLHDTVDPKNGGPSSQDRAELEKVSDGIENQISMIEDKMARMQQFKDDLQELSDRVKQYLTAEENK